MFSYRLKLSQGSFFAQGNGYADYVRRCHALALEKPWVLVADISDFYNRIYLHRLNAAICYANHAKEHLAKSIEEF